VEFLEKSRFLERVAKVGLLLAICQRKEEVFLQALLQTIDLQ